MTGWSHLVLNFYLVYSLHYYHVISDLDKRQQYCYAHCFGEIAISHIHTALLSI